ncbi:YqiA/YcfP family alpha/beta fold hydrolase [Alkalimarinus sediminis]|uniref:Esterase YqiA n=1 Tax=Alkalimarinus sediminis TaxID=1632866 RepID=A0A9E8HGY3_9ALTE|nr:YqiA/YcfP family alpha/beta fold hydrolase [Alkalimarinus sediminis]UZW74050.1 esterase YqiA [Alkalimarinus sediminis]
MFDERPPLASKPQSCAHTTLIYLHGFNSSPESHKAQFLKTYLESAAYNCDYIIPRLSFSPAEVETAISVLIEAQLERGPVALIGSSLGGYYGVYFAEKYGLKAALINPAVKPYELLIDYLGENQNLYSGEHYSLTNKHMDELLAMDIGLISRPENLLLLTQTADQTLDYREALLKLKRSPAWIQSGGSHEYSDFNAVIPAIMSFLQIPNRSAC